MDTSCIFDRARLIIRFSVLPNEKFHICSYTIRMKRGTVVKKISMITRSS